MLNLFRKNGWKCQLIAVLIAAITMSLMTDATVVLAQQGAESAASVDDSSEQEDEALPNETPNEANMSVNGESVSPETQRMIVAVVGACLLLAGVLTLLSVASMWAVFSKAGKPGWAAIIPVYQVIVLLEVAGKPIWWLFLLVIPFVNLVVALLVLIQLAKNFGKGPAFGIGLFVCSFLFFPILGFGKSRYLGPQVA